MLFPILVMTVIVAHSLNNYMITALKPSFYFLPLVPLWQNYSLINPHCIISCFLETSFSWASISVDATGVISPLRIHNSCERVKQDKVLLQCCSVFLQFCCNFMNRSHHTLKILAFHKTNWLSLAVISLEMAAV